MAQVWEDGMEFERVVGNKKDYLPLLLLADEQEDMIDRYLDKGEMYLAKDPAVVGECVVCRVDDGVYEIKNIATDPALHGKGYGRALIEYVMEQYRGNGHTMLVGTGDSPLTVPFYKRCGFTEHHRVKNFFPDNYDHPIVECGVTLCDMVYLSRPL